ncbi:hypothetical protein AAFF_G00421130 [Aldrovandia affinis]|uniref:Uncharacterized protein n=1 Tax=Aldrovandia affinis TaxID=143900 RepID=A0AAD7S9U1_9TELE|nr:hypothetical protein AAFF_G00421130 [Aldrovandia affinis]
MQLRGNREHMVQYCQDINHSFESTKVLQLETILGAHQYSVSRCRSSRRTSVSSCFAGIWLAAGLNSPEYHVNSGKSTSYKRPTPGCQPRTGGRTDSMH